MAEIQTNTESGEMTQVFIEFVMMQSQNAALFLGQIPNPQTGEPEVNLELARMFIDQLVMIREKTRGNLSADEQKVLANAIGGLQMAFVEATRGEPASGTRVPESPEPSPELTVAPAPPEPVRDQTGAPPAEAQHEPEKTPEPDSKKRFTKSYG